MLYAQHDYSLCIFLSHSIWEGILVYNSKNIVVIILLAKTCWTFMCSKRPSNALATWCEELTHLKRPWCFERLKDRGEGEDRSWDGWMASPTQWTWVWVNSCSWWWTERPDVLQSRESQRVRHDWETEVNWTEDTSLFKLH